MEEGPWDRGVGIGRGCLLRCGVGCSAPSVWSWVLTPPAHRECSGPGGAVERISQQTAGTDKPQACPQVRDGPSHNPLTSRGLHLGLFPLCHCVPFLDGVSLPWLAPVTIFTSPSSGCCQLLPACHTYAHIATTSILCRTWPHSLAPAAPVVARRSGQRCCCLLRQQLPPLLLPPSCPTHPGLPRLVPRQDVRARSPSCLWAGKVAGIAGSGNNLTAWKWAGPGVRLVLISLSWASLVSLGGQKAIISQLCYLTQSSWVPEAWSWCYHTCNFLGQGSVPI